MNSKAGLREVGCVCLEVTWAGGGTGGRYCSEGRQGGASLFGPGVTG